MGPVDSVPPSVAMPPPPAPPEAATVAGDGPVRPTRAIANAAYYPNWRVGAVRPPSTLPVNQLSHVFYAFGRVAPTGKIYLANPRVDRDMEIDRTSGCLRALTQLKREPRGAHLKILLSVGPPDHENRANFSSVARDPLATQVLVDSAAHLMEKSELDGLDIFCASPGDSEEAHDFVRLLFQLRLRLPAPSYILTAALPANEWVLDRINLSSAQGYVDFFNLFAFEFKSSSPEHFSHHAQLTSSYERSGIFSRQDAMMPSARGAVEYMWARGVHAKKIMLGVPASGRGYSPPSGPGQSFTQEVSTTTVDYLLLPMYAMTEMFDEHACAAYCLHDGHGVDIEVGFVSYDNPLSVFYKAKFVRENGLAGLFYWHVQADNRVDGRSLVEAGFRGLKAYK